MAISVADNFQYLGTKPLDARLKFASVSDMVSTAAASLYDGCFAYVTATKKYYSYDSTNTVDVTLGKWREYSSGSGDTIQVDTLPTAGADELGNVYQYIGSTTLTLTHGYFYECVSDGAGTPTYSWEEVSTSKGGHEIKNDGVVVTSRDTMNFTDFDITDDPTNEETDVKAHRLTSAEFSEICTPLPGAVSDMPVLFDETGTEYVIGWHKLANGTKKPVYRKTISLSNLPKGQTTVLHGISNLGAVEKIYGAMKRSDDNYYICVPFLYGTFSSCIYIFDVSQTSFQIVIGDDFNNLFNYANCGTVTIEYTKSTDTPSA